MKEKWPKHIGMSRREFILAKKRVLKHALLAFDCRERDAGCAGDLLTGAGFLPADVQAKVSEAYRALREAQRLLNKTQ